MGQTLDFLKRLWGPAAAWRWRLFAVKKQVLQAYDDMVEIDRVAGGVIYFVVTDSILAHELSFYAESFLVAVKQLVPEVMISRVKFIVRPLAIGLKNKKKKTTDLTISKKLQRGNVSLAPREMVALQKVGSESLREALGRYRARCLVVAKDYG